MYLSNYYDDNNLSVDPMLIIAGIGQLIGAGVNIWQHEEAKKEAEKQRQFQREMMERQEKIRLAGIEFNKTVLLYGGIGLGVLTIIIVLLLRKK